MERPIFRTAGPSRSKDRFLHADPDVRSPRAFEAVLLAILIWGALAFGAVYPWAYGPLAAAGALAGAWALRHAPR